MTKNLTLFNRIAILSVAMIMLLIMIPSIKIEAKENRTNRIVKVGYVDTPHFSEGKSDNDVKSGYAYEYLQKIASYTGWKYEYVYGGWAELLDKLESGEIDIMPGVSYTEDRAKTISYPDYTMGYENYYIYAYGDQPFMQGGVSAMSGIKIGCIENSMEYYYLSAWNEAYNNICDVIAFANSDSMYMALNIYDIDAIVDTDTAVFAEDMLIPVTKIGESVYFLGVSKKSKEVLDELNTALAKVNFTDPYLTETLHNDYFAEASVQMYFSDEEEKWLEEHKVIRIGYEKNFLAFCGYDEKSGEMVGMLRTFVDYISNENELLKVEVEVYPYETVGESMAALEAGEVDALFPIYHSLYEAEKQNIFLSNPIVKTSMTAIIGNNVTFNESFINSVAVTSGFTDIEWYIKEKYPHWRIIHYPTFEDCIKAVQRNEVDCVVESTYVYKTLFDDSTVKTVALSKGSDVSFAISRENTEVLSLLNRFIGIAPNTALIASLSQYSNPVREVTLWSLIKENIIGFIIVVFSVIGILIWLLLRAKRLANRATKAEKDTADLNNQLMANQEKLEQALESANRANAAKTTFLSRMSHDIRTPLNGILGLIELGEKHSDDKEFIDENREKAKVAANHLLSLISDVLEVTKMDNDAVVLAKEPFDIYQLASDVLIITKARASDSGITVYHKDCAKDMKSQYVFGSPLHVRQIFINILGNAVKYNKPGGSITCTLETLESTDKIITYRTIISDTGIGMSEEFIEHIFEPFSQEGNDARSVYQGTGLGMAIVKSLVDKMGGTIEIKSKLGVGTTFYITLTFEKASEADMPKKLEYRDVDIKGMKVLLVEDNELNREISHAILSDAGAIVDDTCDGQEAVEKFSTSEDGTYDVILMDLMMPVMDGYKATVAIRSLERSDAKKIPIVAVTANAFTEDIKKCLDTGMNGHIAKPIRTDELIGLLGQILDEE